MKELLNRYQARLTRREDERVWGGIEGALRGDRVTKRRSRFFRLPSAGLAVAAAAVAITLVVKQGESAAHSGAGRGHDAEACGGPARAG